MSEGEISQTKDADALFREAVDAQVAGDLATAECLYGKASQLGHVEGAFHLGELLGDLDRPAEAAGAYELAMSMGDREARLNLAELFARFLGRRSDAISLYEEAIAAGDMRGLVELGALFEREGDVRRAAEEYG